MPTVSVILPTHNQSKQQGPRLQDLAAWIAVAIPIGVAIGIGDGVWQAVWIERYLYHHMYYLICTQLVRHLNCWVALMLGVVLIFYSILRLLRKAAPSVVWLEGERQHGYIPLSVTIMTTVAFIVGVGYPLNHYWLPRLWSVTSFLGNAVFLALTVVLSRTGYAFAKRLQIPWWAATKTNNIVALLFVLLFFGVNGTNAFVSHTRVPTGPHVIFICIDALRPDHLGSYGYHRDTSPFLDHLANEGVRFEYAYSQESYTMASVPSFFTSLYPVTHQVLYDEPKMDTLNPRHLTLAEILKDAGYTTAAFVYNPHLRSRFGFGQGFEFYSDHKEGFDRSLSRAEAYETARKLLIETLQFVRAHEGKKLFLYLHYRDVHAPYALPPPYDRLYVNASGARDGQGFLRDGQGPENVEDMVTQYDGEIRYTNDYIQQLFRELQGLHILQDTLVIINADHGEEFWEAHGEDPGYRGHGRTLYEELIRVPLIFWGKPLPRQGLVVKERVENLDILPTVLDLLGFPIPPDVQGRSFVPLLEGKSTGSAKPIFSGGKHGRGAVLVGDWKYYRFDRAKKLSRSQAMKRPSHEDPIEVGEELYDLRRDPQEHQDVARQHPKQLVVLRKQLDEWFTRYGKVSVGRVRQVQPDSVTVHELKALGYLQ